jgi:succinyl-CoA---D-citramalate CoA-transferase
VRIVELANVVAGPSVGRHLSDFGAEIVKIERPGVGDAARSMGGRIGERTAWWLTLGRKKRSVTLDLKQPKAREAVLRLVGEADALVDSNRPGVLERQQTTSRPCAHLQRAPVTVSVSASAPLRDWS